MNYLKALNKPGRMYRKKRYVSGSGGYPHAQLRQPCLLQIPQAFSNEARKD